MAKNAAKIQEYHAHIYFTETTRSTAEELHAELGLVFGESIVRNSIAYGPRGPHVPNMFGIDIPLKVFEAVVSFLILNHGRHSVLIHPVTGNELLDHTHHALWLGERQPLDLSVLV